MIAVKKALIYGYDENENGTTDYTTEILTFDEFGNSIGGSVLKDGINEVRANFTPLVAPSFSVPIDFTTAESTWTKFAHGHRYNNGTTDIVLGDWTNNKADSDDQFSASGAPYKTLSSDLFDSTTDTITVIDNLATFVGLVSPFKFETYVINGKMYSDTADDDIISFVIAYHVDDFGKQNTLSLCATTGGCDFVVNPSYIEGDNTEFLMTILTGTKIPPKWALVYNLNQNDMYILKDEFGDNIEVNMTGSEDNYNWNDILVEDFIFKVTRSSDIITADCSWTINGTTFNYPLSPLTFDLTSDDNTLKFRGAKSLGFGTYSQNGGGFKDIMLENPSSDYLGIIRIEPREVQTDKGILEFDTTEGNATIGYDGTKFIVSATFDSDILPDLENFKISGHIAPIDNLLP